MQEELWEVLILYGRYVFQLKLIFHGKRGIFFCLWFSLCLGDDRDMVQA